MTITADHTLARMEEEVYQVNQANGWFDDERTLGDDVALLHSEVSEMFEAYRDWGFEDVTLRECKTFDHSHPTPEGSTHLCKPQGFGSECADVLVRLLDTQRRRFSGRPLKWNALVEVETCEDFNVGYSIGEHIALLHAYIVSGRYDHLLSYLVTWCARLNLDLQDEFDRKLAYNITRGHRHGGKLL